MNSDARKAVVTGSSNRINKIVLLVCDVLLMAPYIIMNYEQPSQTIAAVVILLILCAIVLNTSKDAPASASLLQVVLADFCCYAAVMFQALEAAWFSQSISRVLGSANIYFYLLVIGGAVLLWFGAKKQMHTWLFGLGLTAIGSAFILRIYSNFDIANLHFNTYGYHTAQSVWVLFLMAALSITVYMEFIALTATSYRNGVLWMSAILTVVYLVYLIADNAYVCYVESANWEEFLTDASAGFFAWWKVILASVVILAMVLALYVREKERICVDGYFLILLMMAYLGIRICLSNPFWMNWVLALLLLVGTCLSAMHDYSGTKFFSLYSEYYLVVQFVVFVAAVLLLENGFWMNVVLSAAFGAFFYNSAVTGNRLRGQRRHWMMIPFCILTEAAAWMYGIEARVESFLFVVMLLVVSEAAMYVLTAPHPSRERVAPRNYKTAICIFTAVLGILAVIRG